MSKVLVVCTTDSMIWNFLIPHIKRLMEQGHIVECASSKTGSFFDDLINIHSLIMHQIDFERSPYNIKNIRAYKTLNKLVEDNKYDAIFCHEPIGGIMGRLVGHKHKCKVIYMAHGFHFFKGAPIINNTIYYFVEKFFSRYTDVLLTINEEDYQATKKMYAKQRVKINGIGIDIHKFVCDTSCDKLRSEWKLKNSDFLLISVGELIKRKNHLSVIKAIAKLNNPCIHFFIAGNGELKETIQKQIKLLNLENQVHLLGYRRDINELCNSADVFLLPSFQEGLSVALMEAMACRKPIIASRIRGNIDLIDEEKGGILVDVCDVNGYAKAIQFMHDNRDILYEYGKYNEQKVKKFDIESVKKQLDPVYKKCLEVAL